MAEPWKVLFRGSGHHVQRAVGHSAAVEFEPGNAVATDPVKFEAAVGAGRPGVLAARPERCGIRLPGRSPPVKPVPARHLVFIDLAGGQHLIEVDALLDLPDPLHPNDHAGDRPALRIEDTPADGQIVAD